MVEKKIVRFSRAYGVYNAGEVAGFEPKKAAQLIAEKYATPFAKRAVIEKDSSPAKQEIPPFPEIEALPKEPEGSPTEPEKETEKPKRRRGRPRKRKLF